MSVESGRNAIGTAASPINSTDVMPFVLHIHNDDNTDAVYLGGSAVGTATGMRLNKLEHVEIELAPNDQLYAVSGKEGHTISWMKLSKAR